MATGSQAPLRADARRNREQILAAAAAAFAGGEPSVPMEEIARQADVGVGTLYRHFPDRETLVLATIQHSLGTLLTIAREAAATDGPALDALVRSLSGSGELRLTMRIPELFGPATAASIAADATIARIRREIVEIVEVLVQAAQREGSLRPDVGARDVMHLFTLLLRDAQATPDETTFLRARAIVVDGLRARPGPVGGPLPGRPVTSADLDGEAVGPGSQPPRD